MTGESFCQAHDDCTADLTNFIVNCAFIVACFCVILWKISRKLSLPSSKQEVRFQEHNSRWILFIVLFLICLTEIGDAFIIPSRHHSYSLKIPAVFSLLSALTAAWFYSKMETWNQLKPLFILLIYWPIVISSKIFKLASLFHSDLDVHHLTVTITLCYLVVYLLSFLVEVNLIWINKYLSSWQSIALPLNDPPDTQYRRPWVSLPSKATFYWMNALIWRGLKRSITQQCLGSLAQECQVQGHFNKFKEIYSSQSSEKNAPSLWKSLFILLWRPLLLGGLMKILSDFISLIAPLAVGIMVSFVVKESSYRQTVSTINTQHHVTVNDFLKNGYVMAIAVLLSQIITSIFTHNLIHLMNRVAIQVRSLVQMLVYEKSLKLSVWPKEMQLVDAEEVRCLVTDDGNNLMQFVLIFHYIWSFAFKMLILTLLIFFQLGYGAFVGIFVSLLFLLPAQYQLRKIMEKSHNDAQTIKEGRLRKMKEMLLKMLCLKTNSWEIFFAHKIRHIRQRESRLLLLISLCWWLHDALTWTAVVLMSIVAFSVYTSAEREILTSQAAFSAAALFVQILFCIFTSPALISITINGLKSLKKLEKFISTSELSDKKFHDFDTEGSTVLEFEEDSGSVVLRIKDDFTNDRPERYRDTEIFLSESDEEITGDADAAIQLDEASFSWDQSNKEPVLRDLTLTIPIGKITLICSKNRTSERAFLSSLLGELYTVNGSITWTRNSPIAFVPLIPWLQQISIRDNILFGIPYDAQRYNRIVAACGLQREFDQWPSGDLSLRDDIELSISQKHRISIARALYSKCKIIILDDVFSTMDSVLSLHVFEEGLRKLALRYRRTVIAASRQTHILPMGDLLVVLENETIKFQGNWRQLQEWDPDLESTLIPNNIPNDDIDDVTENDLHPLERISNLRPALKITNRGILQTMGIYIDEVFPKPLLNPDISIVDYQNTSELKNESEVELDDSQAPVIKPETSKDKNKIVPTLTLLGNLCLQHCGWLFLVSLVILFLSTHLLLVGKDIWLLKWSNEWNKHGEEEYSGHYLTLYNVLCILGVVNLGALCIVSTVTATRASSSFYNSIIDASMSFNNFTNAKIDNIMSALRIHFAQLDEKLPIVYHYFWLGILCVIITFISFGVTIFIFLLLLLFAMFIYVLQRLFNKFYSKVNELLSTSTKEIISHFTESMKGLILIRSFREEKNFREKLFDLLDNNQLTFLVVEASRRWVGFVFDVSVSIIIFIVSIVAVHNGVTGSLTPGFIGLALVYMLMLPIFLKWLIYAWPEMRSDVNSLKTLEPYSRMSSDDNQGTMIPEWPNIGKIQVENLSLSPTMTNVSFLINPGEKVGIHDINGSDLSTLAHMFVRLTRIPEGSISIDDTNISSVLPALLRLRIAIISRDDSIFNGTIRTNLDMKGSFGDEELWSALKTVNLKNRLSKLNEGLDYELDSESNILTNEEIQLLCLARAILHRPKIIITNELGITLLKTVFDIFPTYSTISLSTELTSLGICDRILELDYGYIVD